MRAAWVVGALRGIHAAAHPVWPGVSSAPIGFSSPAVAGWKPAVHMRHSSARARCGGWHGWCYAFRMGATGGWATSRPEGGAANPAWASESPGRLGLPALFTARSVTYQPNTSIRRWFALSEEGGGCARGTSPPAPAVRRTSPARGGGMHGSSPQRGERRGERSYRRLVICQGL